MNAHVLHTPTSVDHRSSFGRTVASGLRLLLCAIVLISATGCQSKRLGRIPAPYRNYHEAGMAVIGPTYEFDATTKVTSTRPVLMTLKSNHAKPYRGKDVYPDFLAYANPADQGGAGEIEVGFSEPVVEVRSGYALLIGTSPMGKTTRIRAVGEGTTMIIEIDASGAVPMHRVYLVADDHSIARIFEEPTGARRYPDLTVGTYGEIQDVAGAVWTFKGEYENDPDRAKFVEKVRAEAKPFISK